MSKLFGTDGIRGIVNMDITRDIAFRLGNALGSESRNIVVGRDTRLSGVELLKSFRKGVLDAGSNLIDLGIVPTPVVSYVTMHREADYGVAITASHNSKEYNGLKVFNHIGEKIKRDTEDAIEERMKTKLFVAKNRGKELQEEACVDEYKNMLFDAFLQISGLNFAFDTTNGALSHLGTEVISREFRGYTIINNEGDGNRINEGSGAIHPEVISAVVREKNLDGGFAFDGDGDRIIGVTSSGRVLNGDLMLYAIAKYMKSIGKLNNNIVVGTPYTNIGIEKALNNANIELMRSDVGDSNVQKMMCKVRASLGGERAGHIIMSDYSPTGDGLLVALYLCKIIIDTGKTLDELTNVEEYPTGNFDVNIQGAREIVKAESVARLKDEIENVISGRGRILVRSSGTESKVRIMVESQDAEAIEKYGNMMKNHILELAKK